MPETKIKFYSPDNIKGQRQHNGQQLHIKGNYSLILIRNGSGKYHPYTSTQHDTLATLAQVLLQEMSTTTLGQSPVVERGYVGIEQKLATTLAADITHLNEEHPEQCIYITKKEEIIPFLDSFLVKQSYEA